MHSLTLSVILTNMMIKGEHDQPLSRLDIYLSPSNLTLIQELHYSHMLLVSNRHKWQGYNLKCRYIYIVFNAASRHELIALGLRMETTYDIYLVVMISQSLVT